ncbi:hypothetical protein LVJ94_27310 [Pendulispora rubella]|uniref:Cytochrome c domain-containing protein n=1 Tax=Pendulispora rubella TaxID=2741070 RepID=A0ABZ2KQ18_9BACT
MRTFLAKWETRGCLSLAVLIGIWASACSSSGSGDEGEGNGENGTPNPEVSVAPPGTMVLPIEVLGTGSPSAPAIAESNLGIDAANVAKAAKVYFVCSRCGFYGAPEFEATTAAPTKVKASFRLIGGGDAARDASVPWVDITDANVELADPERVSGGVNGGFFTTRITVELDAATRARLVALPSYNRIQFRFNGTDGESNGFRILDVRVQDGAAADIGKTTIQRTDPKVEKEAGKNASPDAEAGKKLWYGADVLSKSAIVNRKIHASCSSCHAENARDLQYFNYSNNAIVQRSRYHGLTEQQGKQIAAFVRYAQRDVPHVPQASPWAPPYQPAAGLDAKPVVEWAAGGGLDAVLSSASATVNAIFGKPLDGSPAAITQADVDRVMNPAATMNAREMPVPLQYPDWNAWLPTTHPSDVWPNENRAEGSFEAGGQFADGARPSPLASYQKLDSWLAAHVNPNGKYGDWSHLTPNDRAALQGLLKNFGWDMYRFMGGGRGNHIYAGSGLYGLQYGARNLKAHASPGTTAGAPAAFTDAAFIERAMSSGMHWVTTKMWELEHKYGLEGNQAWFMGEKDASGAWKGRGESRGSPFNTAGAFFLAPHMLYQEEQTASGKREWYFAWETDRKVASYYRTNQWYAMQVSLNPGGQGDWVNFPIDWPYLTRFDQVLADAIGTSTPAHAEMRNAQYFRLLHDRIKSAQYVNNAIPLNQPDPKEPENLLNNRGRYGRGQVLKHLVPTNFLDWGPNTNQRHPNRALDQLAPGLFLKVVNGAISQYNALFVGTNPADWRRCDPNNTSLGDNAGGEPLAGFRFCLDRARTPVLKDDKGRYYIKNDVTQTTTDQTNQYGIIAATDLGADPQRVKAWSDWIDRAWPK